MEQNTNQNKIIAIGCDHAGVILKDNLKQYLENNLQYKVIDHGCYNNIDKVDYPEFALNVCKDVVQKQIFGVLVCGSGIGISITANKIQGIRSAVCHDQYTTQKARENIDSNIIVFGERVTGNEVAQHALKIFLETKFNSNNNIQLEKLQEIEKRNLFDTSNLCEGCYKEPYNENCKILGYEYLRSCKRCYAAITYAQKEFKGQNIVTYERGFFAPQIDCILENKLFLGNANGSRSKEMLQKNKITDILVSGNGLKEVFPGEFNYKTLQINDSMSQDLKKELHEGADFINNGKIVYVHCFAGVSRSASMVIAYLIKYQNMDFENALQHVKSRRGKANPNLFFQQQLKEFQTEIQQQQKQKQ